MQQRWGLPVIAWPSRLRPNYWDLVALPLVLGLIALVAWGGIAMGAHYQGGEALAMRLDPGRLPEYALRTVLRMGAALVASLVFSLAYAALAAKSRQAEKILIPVLDILQSVPILGFLSITVTGFIAQKCKIPDVAIFLIVGIAIGPQALGLINIRADSALYQIILLFGASYILFDGGASLRLQILGRIWITIVVIATVGVLITAAITGFAAHVALGLPWIVALLMGAVLASTDPATLVPIFRQVKVHSRVAQTVISESAFNDAMGAILTFGVLAAAMGTGEFSLASSLFELFKQSAVGIVAGAVFGYLVALLIAHERWAFLSEYAPVVTLVAVIGAYFAADGLQASGFP